MKKCIKNSIQTGIVTGLILIFLDLIGFSVVLSNMLSNLFKNTTESGQIAVFNLLLLFALILFFLGFRSISKESKWSEVFVSSILIGLFSSLVIIAMLAVVNPMHLNGAKFRDYLPQFSPDNINFFMLYETTVAAVVLRYAATMILSATLGAVVAKGIFKTDGWHSFIAKQTAKRQAFLEKPEVEKVFGNRWTKIAFFAIALFLLYFLPTKWGGYWNYVMGTVGIYILLGLGLNIIVGLSGQLMLGYVAWFAIGAYTFGLLTALEPHGIEMNFWLALLVSVLVSTLTGILLGLPILNLRGDYLAIVTLAFGEMTRILIKSDLLENIANGPRGVRAIGQPTLFGKLISTDVNFMHLIIFFVLVLIFIASRIQYSRTGRTFEAIQADETVAKATGIDVFKNKLLALAIGAAIAGLAGALFASRNQFTGPEDHVMMVSINVLCLVIVGGMGSIPGVILGSFVLKGLPELLRDLSSYRMLVFGALLVLMMLARPEGLLPMKRPKLAEEYEENKPDKKETKS